MVSSSVTIAVNSDITTLYTNSSTATRVTSAMISFRRYMDNIYDNIRIGGMEYTVRYRDYVVAALKSGFNFALIYCMC